MTTVLLDKCLFWTTVSLDKSLIGQVSLWTKRYWTSVLLDMCLLEHCHNTHQYNLRRYTSGSYLSEFKLPTSLRKSKTFSRLDSIHHTNTIRPWNWLTGFQWVILQIKKLQYNTIFSTIGPLPRRSTEE